MRAKSFFYVSLGILALVLAYHFGAHSASAASGGQIVGFTGAADPNSSGSGSNVITSDGDVYHLLNSYGHFDAPVYVGNVWTGGGPTPAPQRSWGQLKAQYRK